MRSFQVDPIRSLSGVSADVNAYYEGNVTWRFTKHAIKQDWAANPNDFRARIVLVLFRLTQFLMRSIQSPRVTSYPLVLIYRIVTELVFGLEIRPKTRIGPGLSLFHGFGVVINNEARLGEDVILRHGVTIGHKKPGGGCPVIGNSVEFGAHAIAVGDINIGARSKIGPGCVVTGDIPEDSVVRPSVPTVISVNGK